MAWKFFSRSHTNDVAAARSNRKQLRRARRLFVEQLETRELLASDMALILESDLLAGKQLPTYPHVDQSVVEAYAAFDARRSEVPKVESAWLGLEDLNILGTPDLQFKHDGELLLNVNFSSGDISFRDHLAGTGVEIYSESDPPGDTNVWASVSQLDALSRLQGVVKIAAQPRGATYSGNASFTGAKAPVETGNKVSGTNQFEAESSANPAPADPRVTSVYWSAAQLIKEGRTDELPRRSISTTNPQNPGYTTNLIQYDEEFRLLTSLSTLSVSPEFLSALSGLAVINRVDPPDGGSVSEDPFSWTKIECWIDPNNLSSVLDLSGVMRVDLPGIGVVWGGSASGPADATLTANRKEFATTTISSSIEGSPKIESQVGRAFAAFDAARQSGKISHDPNVFANVGRPLTLSDFGVADPGWARYKSDGRVYVDITFNPGGTSTLETLRLRGVETELEMPDSGHMNAWVNQSDLNALIACGDLVWVHIPPPPELWTGTWMTQGAGKKATLTTRTDNDTGVLTLSSGHGITAPGTVDVFWSGGRRLGMAITATNPTTVSLDGGTGDNLPSQNTAILIDSTLRIQRVVDSVSGYLVNGSPIDGSGIKIGVISDGVAHLSNAIGSGDLPSTTNCPSSGGSLSNINCGYLGWHDEGTAMLEIIHDIAPGAQLFFQSGIYSQTGAETSSAMIDAIEYMVAQGVDIIVDDVSWFDQPFFLDGTNNIADEVKSAIASGVTYVTSAGNANLRHYQAMSNVSAGFNRFDPSGTDQNLNLSVPAGATLTVVLQWSDSWGTSANDFDMYLVDANGNQLSGAFTSSTNMQNGQVGSIPYEIVQWPNPGGDTTVYLQIRTNGLVSPRELELFALGANAVAAVSISETYADPFRGDALFSNEAVDGVVAVGAIWANDSDNTDDFDNEPNDTIEASSSRGPSTIYTDFNNQSKITRRSISVAALDGVDTYVSRSGPAFPNNWVPFTSNSQFFGTSAAAPHVAAILGLMKDAVGSGSTVDVKGAPTRTGTTSNGSNTITSLTNTADLAAGMSVGGIGIPAGSKIVSVSPTSIVISNAATATGSGVFLVFGALNAAATDLTAGLGGATGYDNVYGAGRANALDAVYTVFMPPFAPALSNDNGRYTSDGVTSNLTPTFTGTVPAGSYVALFDGGVQVGTPVQLGSGVTTYNLTGPTAAANSTHSYTIKVKSSSTSSFYSQASPGRTVYFDSLANVMQSAPDLTSASDTGLSQIDNITKLHNPTFSGNLSSPAPSGGTLVTLWKSSFDGSPLGSAIVPFGTTAYNVTATTAIPNGTYNMSIRAQNIFGVSSLQYKDSSTLQVTVDDAPPVATIAQLQSSAPSRTGTRITSLNTITGLSLASADLAPGMLVSGTGIPANTRIASIDSPTSISLNAYATSSGSGTLSFSPGVGNPTTVMITFNKPVSWPSTHTPLPERLLDLTMVRNDDGSVLNATSATEFRGDSSVLHRQRLLQRQDAAIHVRFAQWSVPANP